MNRTTQIYAGVVVLAGLAGLVYYKAKEDQKIGTAETTNAELPELKAPEDVDQITIKNGDKPEVVLQKKGEEWIVTKPVEARANQEAIKSIVGNLKDLKAKEAIIANADESSKKEYEFAGTKAVHVTASKGGEKKLDVTFGKSGARGQLAMVDGKPGIYAVSGYSGYLYTREVKGFRDTEIFKFDDANANQVTVENKSGTLSFTKDGDKWAGTHKGQPIKNFDEGKVKDLLRSFKSLSADDFGDGKNASELGLAEPSGKVTIQLKDGAGKYVLKVGNVSTGTNHWVQKEGSDQIFSILSYQSDWALAEPTKFQKPADAGADSGKGGPAGMPGMPMGMPPGMGMPHGMGGDDDDGHGH
jgi:hypothetical protein